jgi:hypothetical protein
MTLIRVGNIMIPTLFSKETIDALKVLNSPCDCGKLGRPHIKGEHRCTCRLAKCDCGERVMPIHKYHDNRRYCPKCGRNMGCTKCEGIY